MYWVAHEEIPFMVNLQLAKSLCYSWPLNNMGLNYTHPLTCGFFSMNSFRPFVSTGFAPVHSTSCRGKAVSSHSLPGFPIVDGSYCFQSMVGWIHGCEGTTVELITCRFTNMQVSVPLTPHIIQGPIVLTSISPCKNPLAHLGAGRKETNPTSLLTIRVTSPKSRPT